MLLLARRSQGARARWLCTASEASSASHAVQQLHDTIMQRFAENQKPPHRLFLEMTEACETNADAELTTATHRRFVRAQYRIKQTHSSALLHVRPFAPVQS